jgi:hypothetical protein
LVDPLIRNRSLLTNACVQSTLLFKALSAHETLVVIVGAVIPPGSCPKLPE